MASVSVTGLAKSFRGTPVLRGVDMQVEAGRLVAVLGASGSGKTTLLRLLCGFERVDAGSIRIDGREVAAAGLHLAPEQRRIGYVAQEGALFPHLPVAANVSFGLGLRQRRARHRVDELLRLVRLSPALADRLPHELSGGEQQRVALARALAPQPALVLLDEPFSALDAALRLDTRQAVAVAIASAGATALLVTHDQSEALSMGHQVAVLREGRLIQIADPQTLYRRPVDADLARFVGEAVLLPGVARDGWVDCALGRLRLAEDAGRRRGRGHDPARADTRGVIGRHPGTGRAGHLLRSGCHRRPAPAGRRQGVGAHGRACGPGSGATIRLAVDGEIVTFAA